MTQARTNWFTRLFGNRRPKAPDSLPREEELPRALSMARIGDHLTRRGYHFRVDDDGDSLSSADAGRSFTRMPSMATPSSLVFSVAA